MCKLSSDFFECMKSTLKDNFDDYISCFDDQPFRGLRVNTLKCNVNTIQKSLKIKMKKSPFCVNGFYISNDEKGLGNHPLHHAGAFYLQEPSAMSAVTALDVQKNDNVLDLCAAPGGKSTQIAADLQGTGLLIANEVVQSRAKILCSNIERMGVQNCVVTSAMPDVLCSELQCFFDKILVDAPCSGEGMVRREKVAVSEWKYENRAMCALRQAKILDSAAMALKPGGIMVYSTCTLSGEENEQTICAFLERHRDFCLDDITASFGRQGYTHLCNRIDIVKTRRILPQDGGEGHFVARLKKISGDNLCDVEYVSDFSSVPLFKDFYNENFTQQDLNVCSVNNNIFLYPNNVPKIHKSRMLKCGIYAGEIVKNRFQPAHDLYMSRPFDELKKVANLSSDDIEIRKFLHGDVIECDKKGYCAVAVDGVVTGFGKASDGVLKNHYPKGLRTLKI